MSQINVTTIRNRTGGPPSLDKGAVVTGVVTATTGNFTGNITAVDGTFTGDVNIAGTMTYEDVTRIDSVGIVTAGGGLYVGRTEGGGTGIGITATPKGHIIAAGVVTATQYNDANGNINRFYGVGIHSAGTIIGTGVTILNFVGTGNTVVDRGGNQVDVSISGGTGGGGGAVLDITACLFV